MGLATTGFLAWRSSRIGYCCWGSGPRLLVCFHGYGETAESFACLIPHVNQEFTILGVDLPFHGRTEWNEGLYLDPADLLNIVSEITGRIKVQGIAKEHWTFFGYSMGARVVMGLVEKAPERVEKLVLAAPDGLTVNGWYRLVTRWRTGNRLFRWFMRHPALLFGLLHAARGLRLLNKSMYTFTVNYVCDKEERDNLYNRWTTLRGFKVKRPDLCARVKAHRIPVRLVYGRSDHIIRIGVGEDFNREIAPYGKLVGLDCGHRVLQEKYAAVIAGLIKE